jgi:hypothetical protein
MSSDNNPTGGESLLFASTPPRYHYRVAYWVRDVIHTLVYNSVHEVILNLPSFKNEDTITCISREDNKDFMSLTAYKFKISIGESIHSTNHDALEGLYLRVLLTNRYSKNISDRGRFQQFNYSLTKWLTSLRGGIDSHFAYERKVVLYLKYRRMSAVHLLAVIADRVEAEGVQMLHLNIPYAMANQGLFIEALKLHVPKDQYRLHHYEPIPGADNDHIVETNIASELILIFNQLLK